MSRVCAAFKCVYHPKPFHLSFRSILISEVQRQTSSKPEGQSARNQPFCAPSSCRRSPGPSFQEHSNRLLPNQLLALTGLHQLLCDPRSRWSPVKPPFGDAPRRQRAAGPEKCEDSADHGPAGHKWAGTQTSEPTAAAGASLHPRGVPSAPEPPEPDGVSSTV